MRIENDLKCFAIFGVNKMKKKMKMRSNKNENEEDVRAKQKNKLLLNYVIYSSSFVEKQRFLGTVRFHSRAPQNIECLNPCGFWRKSKAGVCVCVWWNE